MTTRNQPLPDLRDAPAAVLGAGVSGLGAAALLRSHGAWVNLFDESGAEGAKTDFNDKEARQHRLVVHSPGFKPDHPWLQRARQAGAQVYGELDFASIFWPGAVVAVTGTNGKTTLTQFLVHAIKQADGDALAAGNVGYPLSRFFENGGADHTVAVCEVSSFQAEAMRAFRPQALLWTNFAEDHLERHGSLRDYFAAKWKLVELLQRPRLFVGPSVAHWAKELGFKLPSYAQVVDVEAAKPPSSSPFIHPPQRENYALAKAFWDAEHNDAAHLEAAAKTFQLPAHRLEMFAVRGNVRCWDDSKATNFHAAEAALSAMNGPVAWIGGGRKKGGDVAAFAQRIAPQLDFAAVFGEAGPELAEALGQAGVEVCPAANLQEALNEAWQRCRPGGNLLLSPGFSSHDQFNSYAERGESFQRAVLSLKGAPGALTVSACVKP